MPTLICQALTGALVGATGLFVLYTRGGPSCLLLPARGKSLCKARRGSLGEERGQGLPKGEGPGDLATEGYAEGEGSNEKSLRPWYSLTYAAKGSPCLLTATPGTGSEQPASPPPAPGARWGQGSYEGGESKQMARLVHSSEVGTASPGIAPNHHSSPRPASTLRSWRGCWIHGARICCFPQGSSRPSASKNTFPQPTCPGPNLPGVSCLGSSLHRQKICFARFFVCLFFLNMESS